MKNKRKKELCDLVPNLLSPDSESVKLALSILLELPIIKNLNKHFSITINRFSWPGWRDNCPKHLLLYFYNNSRKAVEIRMRVKDYIQKCIQFSIQTDDDLDRFFEHIAYIISFLYNFTYYPRFSNKLPSYCKKHKCFELEMKFSHPDQDIPISYSNSLHQITHKVKNDYKYRELRTKRKHKLRNFDIIGFDNDLNNLII